MLLRDVAQAIEECNEGRKRDPSEVRRAFGCQAEVGGVGEIIKGRLLREVCAEAHRGDRGLGARGFGISAADRLQRDEEEGSEAGKGASHQTTIQARRGARESLKEGLATPRLRPETAAFRP